MLKYRKHLKWGLVAVFLLVACFHEGVAQSTAFPESIISVNPEEGNFQLVTLNNIASILIDEKDKETVNLCAGLFADDVERVTGRRPARERTGKIQGWHHRL